MRLGRDRRWATSAPNVVRWSSSRSSSRRTRRPFLCSRSRSASPPYRWRLGGLRMAERASLVAGELRGYRQFALREDGLYPLVHASGRWDGGVHRAQCASGETHAAPDRNCACGLYGWYLPGAATVCLGAANAVIAARGRCILGDRGFRAEAARIEAVALPPSVRWLPGSAARARQMLAVRYPDTVVYA